MGSESVGAAEGPLFLFLGKTLCAEGAGANDGFFPKGF